jgi:putative transposase
VKKKRFSVEQISGILKQAELGAPIPELCRQHGISEQSYYRWKKVYGGMEPSEARELKALRDENTKLKRLVADLSLDKVMLQDVVQKSGEAPSGGVKSCATSWSIFGGTAARVSLRTDEPSVVPLLELQGSAGPTSATRA